LRIPYSWMPAFAGMTECDQGRPLPRAQNRLSSLT
jgi:hypothetical protein